MTTKTLSKSDLAQFTGSENWYRHGINRNVLYTDGAHHVASMVEPIGFWTKSRSFSRTTRPLPPKNFKSGSSPYVRTRPLRLRATMATATSCSPSTSSTRIFRWMNSLCTSPTTLSTCKRVLTSALPALAFWLARVSLGVRPRIAFESCFSSREPNCEHSPSEFTHEARSNAWRRASRVQLSPL